MGQKMSDVFSIEVGVRDYELDMQGILNNSVYMNYLEHARHEFLHSVGIDFAEYARKGINLVVIRAEMDYKSSLVSADKCRIEVSVQQESKVKFAFIQKIIKLPKDDSDKEKVVMNAKIIGAALNQRGRPEVIEDLAKLFVE